MNEQALSAELLTLSEAKRTLKVLDENGRLERFALPKVTDTTYDQFEYIDPTIVEFCIEQEEAKLTDEALFMRRYRKIGCIAGAGVGIINLINNGSTNQIPLRFGLGAIVGSAVYLSVGEFFSRADLWTKVRPRNREHKKRIDLLRSLPVASAPETQE